MEQFNRSFSYDEHGELVLSIAFNGRLYNLTSSMLYFKSKDGRLLHHDVYTFFTKKPIPEGYIVHHKDGNERNNNFDNLMLLTRSEHVKLHSQNRCAKQKTKGVNCRWVHFNVDRLLEEKRIPVGRIEKTFGLRHNSLHTKLHNVGFLQKIADELKCEITEFFKPKE